MRFLFQLSAFPPVGGTPSLRFAKLLKYFDTSRHQVEVLTPNYENSDYHLDESLMQDVPKNITVSRVDFSGTWDKYWNVLWESIRRLRRNEYDWLVTSTSNQYFVGPGYFASLTTGVNWHCDLEEPLRGGWKGLLGVSNQFAIRRADLLTSMWPPESILDVDLSSQSTTRFLPDGYDPEDFTNSSERKLDDGPTVFFHAGSLIEDNRHPLPVLRIINDLKERYGLSENDFRVEFVGPFFGENLKEEFADFVHQNDLDNFVNYSESVSHEKITCRMKAADVCLAFHETPHLSMKQFEYLGTRKPVLYYYDAESPLKNTFESMESVHWVNYGNSKELRDEMYDLITNTTSVPIKDPDVDQFNWVKLSARLQNWYESF